MTASSRQSRTLLSLAIVATLALAAGFLASTFSAFSATTSNAANTATAGTVTIGDNDSGTAMLTMTGLKPGDTDTGCIKATSTGTLPSLVKLYGTTGGSGLDAYLTLVVTRGSGTTTFDDCTGFTADATNYIGQGAGVLYNGTLAAFADSYAAGLTDPRTATVPEAWTTGETHTYRFALTVADTDAAQGLNYTQTFTWEARNTTLYSQVVLSDQPAAYWKLDEAAGTTAANAVGSGDGTHTNGPVVNQPSGVKDAANAVRFDGVDDVLNIPSTSGATSFTGTTAFSAEAWVRPVAAGSGGGSNLVSNAVTSLPDNLNGFTLAFVQGSGCSVNGCFVLSRANGSMSGLAYDGAVTSTTLSLGSTWYHVVGTYDGTTMRVYVNGALQASAASSRSIGTTYAGVVIGGSMTTATNTLNGTIDEVAVYSTVLSAAQITEHYNAGRR